MDGLNLNTSVPVAGISNGYGWLHLGYGYPMKNSGGCGGMQYGVVVKMGYITQKLHLGYGSVTVGSYG